MLSARGSIWAMRSGRGAGVVAAVALATVMTAVVPRHAAAYSAPKPPPGSACPAIRQNEVEDLEISLTPQGTEVRAGARLAVWAKASQPITFAIASVLPAGDELPSGGSANREPPELEPELDGGVGTAPHETEGFSVFYSTKATAKPGTIYWQASLVVPADSECPESVIRTQIHSVIIVPQPPITRQPEEAPEETPNTQPPKPAWFQTKSCFVPELRGRSLRAATAALRRNHCNLGKVTIVRDHHHARLVVHQSRKPGTRLPHGAAIALTLGRGR